MIPKSLDTLRIDINSGKVRKAISVCQQDTVQRTLNFLLVNSGNLVDISNVLFAEILIHKADGAEADNGCVIDGDSIQYTLRTTDVSALGTNQAQLLLTFADGQTLTTPTFEINVYSKVLDQSVQKSQNEYSALTEMLLLSTEQAKKAQNAANSAQAAYEKIGDENIYLLEKYALDSEAYAVGKRNGVDVNDDDFTYHNNSKYYATDAKNSAQSASTSEYNAGRYYQEARSIVESLGNALVAQGTVTFANLPSLANVDRDGYMWNISDSFVTTSDFVEGQGVAVPMGSNVYKITLNGVAKWDILAGSAAEVFTGTTAEVAQAIQDGRLNEDMMINITDDDSGDDVLDANQIEYDNTTSGLNATSTQNAIDEVKGLVNDNASAIEDIYSDLTEYIVLQQKNYTNLFVGANDNLYINVIPDTIQGYTPRIAFLFGSNNNGNMVIFRGASLFDDNDNTADLGFRNIANQSYSDIMADVIILYTKTPNH